MPGRHGAVRANSSAEIGGVTTATVLVAPGEGRSAKEMASIAVHEAFHLYHGQAHPDWTADEGALMTYPADDAQVLTMRRCESEALRRALAAPAGGDEAVGWAAEALAWRAQRYERLGGPERAVERGIELREGLAQYVERKALGRLDGTTLPEEEYAPDAVRRRAYDVGQAIAVLLDRLHPGWADEINAAPSPALDVALQDALAPRAIPPRALPPDVVLAATRRAAADAAGHAAALARQRDEFLGRPGWTLRVVVEPGEEPLWPQAFDPMNLTASAAAPSSTAAGCGSATRPARSRSWTERPSPAPQAAIRSSTGSENSPSRAFLARLRKSAQIMHHLTQKEYFCDSIDARSIEILVRSRSVWARPEAGPRPRLRRFQGRPPCSSTPPRTLLRRPRRRRRGAPSR
jgi:hypothetical protein